MKSIYDIPLNSAEEAPNFLDQFKGKVTLIVNTTVGCGNANQMEILQRLQETYGGDDFQVVAIPTNDYCGPGITHGKWSEGITCGLDSKEYGKDVYGTTFQFSEMVASNPNSRVNDLSQHKGDSSVNGLGQLKKEPHPMYEEIRQQMNVLGKKHTELKTENDYYSYWLNRHQSSGQEMGGNFEKYLVDKDGYVAKWFGCTVLNYDSEKGVKEAAAAEGRHIDVGPGRSMKIFKEEYAVVCKDIEELIANKRSIINPLNVLVAA
jgi:glutathione peroxidase-family protein